MEYPKYSFQILQLAQLINIFFKNKNKNFKVNYAALFFLKVYEKLIHGTVLSFANFTTEWNRRKSIESDNLSIKSDNNNLKMEV